LWREYIPPVVEVDEEIQLNHLRYSNTPDALDAPWTYEYQAEVKDLAQDTTYTAIIVAKNLSSGEWNGIWWWEDIQESGEQYDLLLSMNRGCYSIETTLYEKEDLNSDPSAAVVLSSNQSEVIVGDGSCFEGVYTEATTTTIAEENQTKQEKEVTPGFSILSGILAMSVALMAIHRKNRTTGI